MRLLVAGASGRTGRLLVELALSRDHEVTAFVRDPRRLGVSHERLRVETSRMPQRRRASCVFWSCRPKAPA